MTTRLDGQTAIVTGANCAGAKNWHVSDAGFSAASTSAAAARSAIDAT